MAEVACTMLVIAVAACPGCGWFSGRGARLPRWTQRDVRSDLEIAAQDPNADQRRQAVVRLAESRRVRDPQVITVLTKVASSDTSPAVRTVAFSALGRSCAASGIDAAIEALEPARGEGESKHAAAPMVRVATLELLTGCMAGGEVADAKTSRAADLAIAHLGAHRSRDVRLAAARMLGYVPRRDVLDALIEALGQRDFGVCYEAQRSLMRLTGQSYDYDIDAWSSFVASAADPFAQRGRLDKRLDNQQPDWWQRQKAKWRRMNLLAGKHASD